MKWKVECDEVQNGIMVCVIKICWGNWVSLTLMKISLNCHWHNCVMTSINNGMWINSMI
jgi:hypothetical protein